MLPPARDRRTAECCTPGGVSVVSKGRAERRKCFVLGSALSGSTRGRLPTGCPENRAVFAASAISYVLRADVHAQQRRCATSLRLVLDIGALLGGLFGAS